MSRKYDRFQPLLPHLENQENIEEVLEDFRVKAETDVECRRQLQAVQYYIRAVIKHCQEQWVGLTDGASNYKSLLNHVRDRGPLCFVTFNYDTLLEAALAGLDFTIPSIDHYIRGPYRLIKLHGSIDWVTWAAASSVPLSPHQQATEEDLIRAAPIVEENDSVIEKDGVTPTFHPSPYFHLPALAIPTLSKQKFVCPPQHVSALQKFIPQVTEIAVIGWRANERNFVEMLAGGLQNPVRIIAACGGEEAANETLRKLREADIKGDFEAAPGGFTDFVVSRRMEAFLDRPTSQITTAG